MLFSLKDCFVLMLTISSGISLHRCFTAFFDELDRRRKK